MSTAPLVGTSSPSSNSTLSLNARKSRYGVSYLSNICAQAGVGLSETSPDEDVLASDCNVKFAVADVRVQVKCTSAGNLTDNKGVRVQLKDNWLRKWESSLVPVYIVVVLVPSDVHQTWLNHPTDGTMHLTGAFWLRVNNQQLSSSISIPKSQRLTADTLDTWHDDLMSVFKQSGAS